MSGTLFNFSFVKKFIDEEDMDNLELLSSYKILGTQGNYYSFEEYLWFLLDSINTSFKRELWMVNIHFTDISEKVTWSLLSMFQVKYHLTSLIKLKIYVLKLLL